MDGGFKPGEGLHTPFIAGACVQNNADVCRSRCRAGLLLFAEAGRQRGVVAGGVIDLEQPKRDQAPAGYRPPEFDTKRCKWLIGLG